MKNIFNQFKEIYRLLFDSAAENQMRINQGGNIRIFGIRFRSYSQLKRIQRRVRRFLVTFLFAFSAWLLGMIVGPLIFPTVIPTEVYIPNGRGDILISNVSKNQITIIFKTLDAAHNNIPLATSAYVEVYGDSNYRGLIKKTNINDFAVTHIINIDGLEEEKMYYFRIYANDVTSDSNENGSAVVSSWGDGYDPIGAFTSGSVVTKCISPGEVAAQVAAATRRQSESQIQQVDEQSVVNIIESYSENVEEDSSKFTVSEIEKESYLYDNAKVQTIITWLTNQPANTTILYREGAAGEMKEMTVSDAMQTKHMAVIMTFKPGTLYYFKVKSENQSGEENISDEYSLLTPRARETMLNMIKNNLKALVRQVMPK